MRSKSYIMFGIETIFIALTKLKETLSKISNEASHNKTYPSEKLHLLLSSDVVNITTGICPRFPPISLHSLGVFRKSKNYNVVPESSSLYGVQFYKHTNKCSPDQSQLISNNEGTERNQNEKREGKKTCIIQTRQVCTFYVKLLIQVNAVGCQIKKNQGS